MKRSATGPRAAARLASRVLDALDWKALGAIYFHWGGERLWTKRRGAVLELGERLARALLPRLAPGGASLWVGAGVAELPVLLAEALAGNRTIVACNLRAQECELLNAGLVAAAAELPLRIVAENACAAAAGQTFDHVGCISVFTDPETWPVLSDVAYGRVPPVQLDVDRFVAERAAARELAHGIWRRLRRPGLVTTSAEEVAWFLEQAAVDGSVVEADDELVPTAVVGDPVGFLAVR